MAGYVGTKAVLLSTTAANVGGDADIGGALDVGGAFTSQGIDDNANATAITIDSSENVGIGTSSIDGRLTLKNPASSGDQSIVTVQNSSSTNAVGKIVYNQTDDSLKIINASTFSGSHMDFWTGNTESMRIDSAGVLIVGNTSSLAQPGTVDAKGYKGNAGVGGAKGNTFNVYWTGSSPQLWIDTTNVGTISVSSDYRIKRNVETQTDEALSRVMQLRPVTYQMADYEDLFNASDDIKEGFIAHEVSEIIPSAVEGEKDCSDQIQSLKLDAIVSVLTKALQEQQVLIETLRADLAALQEAPDEITDLKARVAALEAS